MRRPWRGRILLAVSGLAVALIVGEIAARIVLPLLPDPEGTAWMKDPDCGFRLQPSRPGEYPPDHDAHINRHGFRDRDYPVAKADSVVRILGMGDSFVYGAVPIAQNFLRVAQRRLAEARPDLNAEILLLGAPAYSPEHETALLESFGLGLDPDQVVLNFFVGNDVTGIPVRGRVMAGRMYFPHSPDPVLNLLRKSQLVQLAEGLMYRRWKESAADPGVEASTGRPVVDALYLEILESNLPVYRFPPEEKLQRLWNEAEGYLDRFDAACRGAGVPWLLVLIPGEEQVDLGVRRQALAGLGLDPSAYDFEGPQRRLRRWADGRGVPVLDLLPAMRAAHADTAVLYVPNDTHWNRRGNALAGGILAETLAGWISPPTD